MKQVLMKKGTVIVDEIPEPVASKGYVLVKVMYSCISAGTEISGVKSSGESIIKKALNPEYFKRGLQMLSERGIIQTRDIIKGKFEVGSPLGYSASGVVIEVGEGITDIQVGDHVACAGAGYANHAEFIEVPRNLIVKIPEGVGFKEASTVTLGVIAMQGIRRANITFGENVAIVGMGILGQLAAQICNAAGARVIAIDLDDRRLDIASKMGASRVLNPKTGKVVDEVIKITDGFGADAVIITAATNSSEPLAQAFQMSRRKGRVVLVGVVDMKINREDMYKKELDFLISTSYGPGRYDTNYEEKGVDYPFHYVRWTENRNMQEYLAMLARNKVNLDNIIERVYDIGQAPEAYEELKSSETKPLMVLLKYDEQAAIKDRKVQTNKEYQFKNETINVAIVGAGGFAKGMHLPNLQNLNSKYTIHAVMSRTGSNAKAIAVKYGAKYATTDYAEILNDTSVDLVMICTRHDLHAEYAIKAMKQGKAVFVEKPMALNQRQMEDVLKTIEETNMPYMVGFNRRFSKYAVEAKKHIDKRINPMIINYRMNAGFIPLDNWVHTEEGGGRIIGEGCHIVDLFNFFTGSEVDSVFVNKISPNNQAISNKDNIIASIKYKDGSICTLTYTAIGSKEYAKEYCEIFFDGKTIVIDDYKKITGYGVNVVKLDSATSQKGQLEELVEFEKSIRSGAKYAIPIEQLEQTTKLSFIIDSELE